MAHRHAGGLDGHAAVTGSKAAAGGRLAEGLRGLELGALGRQLQVEVMFEPEHRGRLHRVDEEALRLVGPVLHLDLDGDAVRLVQLFQGPVVQAEPLVLLDGRAELLGQLVVCVRIDGDRLRQVVCQPREMLSGLGVARRPDGQDAHGVGASLFEAVAEETVVAQQPVSTERQVWDLVLDARRQHQLAASPDLPGGVGGLELARVQLPHLAQGDVRQRDGVVAALGELAAGSSAVVPGLRVVPGRDVVHMLRQAVAVGLRVEDDGGADGAAEAQSSCEAGWAAADDEKSKRVAIAVYSEADDAPKRIKKTEKKKKVGMGGPEPVKSRRSMHGS
ncbi:hypothetical protein TRV_06063 [Trichophyton verrucosum HKI 0517]|uniref:Uncharacterized protein n=1 Tax=Trichophyton verrucosum (strain HKI 0517) TaxID=663202 RepID=D4DFW0_TRIVH|nr:uncharacterized protein TRV_06063 [Trichophyton verrucosum HKI 0517]EFE39241.1 hypothetical protein TRV_06063 [Trichophyton verrucosum HKI 0517]